MRRKRATYYCDRPRCDRQWINTYRKKCDLCGHQNVLLRTFRGGFKTIYVTPDVPEHWNLSLDRPVKSRRHLTDLQKRLGVQDFEGYRGANLRQVYTEGGHLRSVAKAR